MGLETDGAIVGVAIAVVTQNKDPEGLCRVEVRYPWHADSQVSDWARVSVPMAGDGRGMVMIPEVGDEVLVAFERGDLRRPYVLGALWSQEQRPPVANDDGQNDKRLVKSRKGHTLLFDDGQLGVVELSHVDGRRVVLDDQRITLEDNKGNRLEIDSQDGTITIEASGQINLKAASIALEAAGTVSIKSGGTLTLQGALVNIN